MNRTLLPDFANPYTCHNEPCAPCVLLAPTDADDAVDVAAILRQATQSKRHLQHSFRQARKLKELLSLNTAEWTLCAIDRFQPSEVDLQGGTAFLRSAVKVQAHVVYIANIGQRGMCFKLTQETIQNLVKLHEDEFLPALNTCPSSWKGTVEMRHLSFTLAVNEFVFHTELSALENLTRDGSGILSGEQEQAAREAIIDLFVPIVPLWQAGTQSQVQCVGQATYQETSPFFNPLSDVGAFPATMPEGMYGEMTDYSGWFAAGAALQSPFAQSACEPMHYPQLLYPDYRLGYRAYS
ncbi:hypothetical protein N7523_005713 [Penicillium sp. IBT 18751x]|nr:hypothetical protein N7523_005713 [Penicillium sp. IBT 18751x]